MTPPADQKTPSRRKRSSIDMGVVIVRAICTLLAAMSVWLLLDAFSLPTTFFSRNVQVPVGPSLGDAITGTLDGAADVDLLTTHSTADADAASAAGATYTLVQAGSRSALIADENGIYLIRPDAMLPDGRRVISIRQTDDGVMVEVTGNVTFELRPNPPAPR